jgi:predicted deacylase
MNDGAPASMNKTKGRRTQTPLRLGGVEVAPGGRATIQLPLTDLSTHTPVTIPVQVIHGRTPGPCLFINAALHGDEINGVEIIRRLNRLLANRRIRGTYIAAPVVNVLGFIAGSRYLPDRRDLNRSFPGSPTGSLAGRMAHIFLNEIVKNCDVGIDLHTGAVHRDNFPQIRANLDDPEIERLARAFGVPILINASTRTGSLRQAAADLGTRVLVYEAGEALRFDERSIRAGVKGVTRVMRAIGMLPESRRQTQPLEPIIARSSSWVRAPQSGIMRATLALGETIERGQLLAAIADPFGGNEISVTAPSDGLIIGRSNLPLVHEGDALFHIVRTEGSQVAAETLDAFVPEEDYEKGLTAALADEPVVT